MSTAETNALEPKQHAQKSDEVLDLLEQATSLTEAIVADVGNGSSRPPARPADAKSTAEEVAQPLQTAAPGQQATQRLNDLLNDPDSGSPEAPKAMPAVPGSAGIAPEIPVIPQAPTAPIDPQGASQPAAPPAPEPPVLHRPAPRPTKTVSELEDALKESAANAGPADSPPVKAKPDPPRPRLSFATFSRMILRLPKKCADALGQAGVGILMLLDRPFSGLAPETKQLAGLLAVGTLLMALVAWLLPGMLESNPFQGLETGK